MEIDNRLVGKKWYGGLADKDLFQVTFINGEANKIKAAFCSIFGGSIHSSEIIDSEFNSDSDNNLINVYNSVLYKCQIISNKFKFHSGISFNTSFNFGTWDTQELGFWVSGSWNNRAVWNGGWIYDPAHLYIDFCDKNVKTFGDFVYSEISPNHFNGEIQEAISKRVNKNF